MLTSCSHGKDADLKNELDENVGFLVHILSHLEVSWGSSKLTGGKQVKTNILSPILVINSFLSLVRAGKEKKIIFISSQSADIEFTRITAFSNLIGYSAAKAGMMVIITKYAAELAPEGIKLLSLSPGWVNTDAGESNPQCDVFRHRLLTRSSESSHWRPGGAQVRAGFVP